MLNSNATSATQSINIANVLLSAKYQKVAEDGFGHIFTPDYFASDWDNIYINPSDMKFGNISKGMRKLVAPTLLISSEESKMRYVLASKELPVYIQNEYSKDKGFGYLLAFCISPEVSPEYIFYMCKFGLWDRLMKRLDIDDNFPSWSAIGQVSADPVYGMIKYTPEEIVSSLGRISIHTLSQQKQLIESAKEQDEVVESHRYEVDDLVFRYMILTRQSSIVSQNSLGLLSEAYRIAAGNYVKQEVLDILSQYKFQQDVLSHEELKFLSKHLNELFVSVMSSNTVSFYPSEGFVQPQEVTEFMCKMASFPKDVTVYNPFAGADSYAVTLPNRVVGEEINSISWAIGQIRLFANAAEKRSNIILGDSFESMKSNEKFSAIITSPAYLKYEGHEISDIVRILYDKLEDGGKIACIVPTSLLFRKDTKARIIREELICEKAIASVVLLPQNIFTGTSVSQAVVVLTKGVENQYIQFGDARGCTRYEKSVYRATTFDLDEFIVAFDRDIIDTLEGYAPTEGQIGIAVPYTNLIGSDLTPSIYLTPKPENGIPLSVIADEVPELKGEGISSEYYITGASIPSGMHRKPFEPLKVEELNGSMEKKYVRVPENAVIIAIVNGNVRTVYTEGFTDIITYKPGSIKILKPNDELSARYLAAILSTKEVTDQIKAQTEGLSILPLNKLDLDQIIIPFYENPEVYGQIISDVLSSEMNNLEIELQNTLDSQKRNVRSTRHAINQTLCSLSAKWERLKNHMNSNNGTIRITDTIGRVNPTSFKDFMDGIENTISILNRQVESFSIEKNDYGKSEEINPNEFIENYIAAHSSTEYKMQNLGSSNKIDSLFFSGENDEDHMVHTDSVYYTFKAPKRLVERIFDNIVSNAKAHGFAPSIANPTIQFDWQVNKGKIEITIKNNGLPLKEGVSSSDVFMSDFSTSLKQKANDGSEHFGIGGYEIKSLMEDYGSVKIESKPSSEFPVIYTLSFNDISIV